MSNRQTGTDQGDSANQAQQWQDAADVERAKRGESDAFDALVVRYQRRAVSVAYRLLGNLHDASDVAQDAFLRAYAHIEKLNDPRRFGPWLMRIVTNLSLNFRRTRSRNPSLSIDELTEGVSEFQIGGGEPDVGEQLDRSQRRRQLRDAIDGLPNHQRVAITLFSIENLPQKEVAKIMDCSVQLVKWNVFQARKALRKALEDDLMDDGE